MKKSKIFDTLNVVGMVLLLGIVVSSFMAYRSTVESNVVTTEVALLQAKEESRLVKEMRLMTLELRNLQSDIDVVRTKLEGIRSTGSTVSESP